MPCMQWPGTDKRVQRVAVFRLDNLGDVLMTGPALRSLRHALPHAHVTYFASRVGSQMAPLVPGVDEVRMHRAVWQDATGSMPLDATRELQFVETLRAGRYDAAVIFTSFSQSPYPAAAMCYLAEIPIRLGQSAEFGGSLLTHWARPDADAVHQVDRNLHLLETAGFPPRGRHLELQIPDPAQSAADACLARHGVDPRRPFVVLAAAASCAARTYPLENFLAAGRRLAARRRLPVVLVGSARERAALDPRLREVCDGLVSLVGETSVPELCGVLRRGVLLLTAHSGPMHIADALRCPQVVLFSGTDCYEQWCPRFGPCRMLQRTTACAPCYRFDCPYALECLDVPPDEIVTVAEQVLDEVRRAGQSQDQG